VEGGSGLVETNPPRNSQPNRITVQSLSKLDAATRQLHLAIDLFFQDADPIGIHTLAGAAHGLLQDLLARRDGNRGGLAQTVHVQPDHRQFVATMITEARNFLKHADRDPNGVLQFNSDWTDFLIFEAIRMHIELAGIVSSQSSFFLIWLSAKYPSVLLLDTLLGDSISELRRIFPALGSPSAQRQPFRAAMLQRSSD
jgi:hypothetical protein